MIHLLIPEEELQIIEEERFTCSDSQISRRLHALYLKNHGYSHQDIALYVGLSPNALTATFKKYASGGLEEVKKMRYVSKQSSLDDHREVLRKHFEEHPPASVKQACSDIEKLTGIVMKKERVRVFLHQLGMKPRKVGGIPSKADPLKQDDFKKKAWNPYYRKLRMGRLRFILLMPLILCLVLFWLFYGLFRGCLLKRRVAESA
jgi:transposase